MVEILQHITEKPNWDSFACRKAVESQLSLSRDECKLAGARVSASSTSRPAQPPFRQPNVRKDCSYPVSKRHQLYS
ncbi:hypothetical protein CH063_14355 [Colletotrichum higginsianum]|uniref:Uncharacterized protein n=1 Tax=Colletotrichum higginsianum (strain IMI 349063) TaxID=759273 RepID=H1VY84_COLHI|nr:hypothetical protein CH063_14355 [Colletotrichum higginsianum]